MTTVHDILRVVNYKTKFRLVDVRDFNTLAEGVVFDFYERDDGAEGRWHKQFGGQEVHDVRIVDNVLHLEISDY